VQDLVALRPDFGAVARQEYAKWYESPQVEHMIEGLRKAGLAIPEAQIEDKKTIAGIALTSPRGRSQASR
jgi:hypothetical protein